MMVGKRIFPLLLGLGLGVSVMTSPLSAQAVGGGEGAVIQPSPFPANAITPEAPDSPVNARGAFIRSLLIPGWGQVASGAVSRGGFYFVAQSASFWMIRKAALARGDAETFTQMERELATARFLASGIDDPIQLRQAVDSDAEVRDWENLVDLRGQQVEDWAAISIFLALLGAADAVVAAHLQDYPEPLTFRILPAGTGERIELAFAFPIGGVAR